MNLQASFESKVFTRRYSLDRRKGWKLADAFPSYGSPGFNLYSPTTSGSGVGANLGCDSGFIIGYGVGDGVGPMMTNEGGGGGGVGKGLFFLFFSFLSGGKWSCGGGRRAAAGTAAGGGGRTACTACAASSCRVSKGTCVALCVVAASPFPLFLAYPIILRSDLQIFQS